MIVEALASVFLVTGCTLSLVGVVGVLRFQDVLSRLHAATKPQVLGLLLVVVAVGLRNPDWGTITTLLIIWAFQTLTAPVTAHMLGRAGYRTRRLRQFPFTRDELADAVERASARGEQPEPES
ncbi:MAG TPA: monovalent cation/H(+) antiporter subunit G [Nocardioidaceae bacterium]|nr:monovalent cation/H(+) antiporter subunit G [Nocardioidaceae bacterium]